MFRVVFFSNLRAVNLLVGSPLEAMRAREENLRGVAFRSSSVRRLGRLYKLSPINQYQQWVWYELNLVFARH